VGYSLFSTLYSLVNQGANPIMTLSRRSFLVGCSAAIAAMAGGRLGHMAFAQPGTAATDEIMLLVFLRGGIDGLNLLAPFDDAIYQDTRGTIAIPDTGANVALAINPQNATFTSSLGLHPKAGPLKELYDAQRLALVHACGLNDDTRSHFDAMDYIERGTPGDKNTGTGWLTRHLALVGAGDGAIPVLSAGSSTPTSLLSSNDAISMSSAADFAITSHWRYNSDTNRTLPNTLKTIYTGRTILDPVGKRLLETIDTIQAADIGAYTPGAGITYPESSFGSTLKTVAQTIKLDLGLKVATVDFGGWDTHEYQGDNGEGYFGERVSELARGLHAFYNDMSNYWGRLTIVVMSEFGRRLGVNSSGGTDHGHGGVMMVLGGNVNGGKVYGQWPGLANLNQNQDLEITTDFRTVLGEIITERLGNVKLGQVFPGLTAAQYSPLNIVNGTAPGPIDFGSAVRLQDLGTEQGQNRVYLPMAVKC
jgi:uncharacterized protein (DUF1501 family)